MNPRHRESYEPRRKRVNHGRSNSRQQIVSQAQKGVKSQRVRQGPTDYAQHAPQAPAKAVTRSVGYQRLISALAHLKAGWLAVFDTAKGWRLRLGERTVRVRRDVLFAVAVLVAHAKGRAVTA